MLDFLEVYNDITLGSIILYMGAFIALGALIYRYAEKYRKFRNGNEEKEKLIDKHTEDISSLKLEFGEMLTILKNMQEETRNYNIFQNSVMLGQIKVSLQRSCEEAINDKEITFSRLQSILDLYEIYSNPPFNANSYIHDIVKKVKYLPVINDSSTHDE